MTVVQITPTPDPEATMITPSDCPFEQHDQSMGLTDVNFKFHDRLVRVPIQMFSDSETFYAVIQGTTSDLEVQSLQLEKNDEEDFPHFMKYMIRSQPRCEIALDAAAYTCILRFVTNWKFRSIWKSVVRDFPTIDVMDKIALARDYYVEEWFVPSLDEYTSLGTSITIQDVERLGSDYVLKIIQIRANFNKRVDDPCLVSSQMLNTESRTRSEHDFTTSLCFLFRDDIIQCDVQYPAASTSDPEDSYLVEMYFLVENCIFKSYRSLWEASPVFQRMFALPVPDNMSPDGCSEAQPIHILEVKKSDFAPFIEMINPRPRIQLDFALSQWTSILKLSTMWEFAEIRQFAINEMEKIGIPHANKVIGLNFEEPI